MSPLAAMTCTAEIQSMSRKGEVGRRVLRRNMEVEIGASKRGFGGGQQKKDFNNFNSKEKRKRDLGQVLSSFPACLPLFLLLPPSALSRSITSPRLWRAVVLCAACIVRGQRGTCRVGASLS
eukprot:663418-Rhodomonas_salina.2